MEVADIFRCFILALHKKPSRMELVDGIIAWLEGSERRVRVEIHRCRRMDAEASAARTCDGRSSSIKVVDTGCRSSQAGIAKKTRRPGSIPNGGGGWCRESPWRTIIRTGLVQERMALKVFNWLNRKMHSNAEYCTIYQDKALEEKEDLAHESMAERDTEALLLHDVLLNGILAIGTLGHNVSSLCPKACTDEDEFLVKEKEVVEEEKYKEEKNEEASKDTMVIAAPSAPAPVVEPVKMHSSSMKEDTFVCVITEEMLVQEVEEEDIAKIQEQPLLMAEKVQKVRTTLADLFAAEAFSSSDPGKPTSQHIIITAAATSTSKPALCLETVKLKKPTKSIPKPVEATRKLSRAVKKMLGKKVHPEQLNGCSNAEGTLAG